MTTTPLPVSVGALVRHPLLPSAHLPARNVDVWCPPGYDADAAARYPVIYMHDGQNLFDPGAPFGGWAAHSAVERLMREEGLPGAIIVGVWNSERRRADYMPARPLRQPGAEALRAELIALAGMEPLSDAYLRFLTSELKPMIDGAYRTRPEREQTFLVGSSMGGLISLYAIVEYPEIFGGAGCLSTHWSAGGDRLVDFFGAALPPPGRHRIYFDYGTVGVDAPYEPFQLRMDEQLRAAGYREGRDFLTRRFDGADHNEEAWRARLDIPLRFLLAGAP